MRLTKLEVHGFKAFADHLEFVFEQGVTAIVGPNGCGKSNVSDAVRWVLGEQRARAMRGAKMEDVIFHGSSSRKAVNMAEVSLHFDNSEGDLPVPFKEVVITRRLMRTGESEYLLNRAPCRLRDIQDLVRGTGLGADSGVVIESRMIDALLSDRPDERRELFEEAAGVGLYRDRRRSAERRLEETTVDLARLDEADVVRLRCPHLLVPLDLGCLYQISNTPRHEVEPTVAVEHHPQAGRLFRDGGPLRLLGRGTRGPREESAKTQNPSDDL